MPAANQIIRLFVWFVLATAAALAGFYLVIAVRRWAQKDERVTTFTLQDLREMRARGQITESEFAAMRATLLAQLDPELANESSPAEEESSPGERRGNS